MVSLVKINFEQCLCFAVQVPRPQKSTYRSGNIFINISFVFRGKEIFSREMFTKHDIYEMWNLNFIYSMLYHLILLIAKYSQNGLMVFIAFIIKCV